MTGARNGRIEMRLIDADAMKDTNNNVIAVIDSETKSKYWISLNDYINAQPTVDTIKHAHWVFYEDMGSKYIECSNCGAESGYDDEINQLWGDYCKYCGAKMDGVTE